MKQLLWLVGLIVLLTLGCSTAAAEDVTTRALVPEAKPESQGQQGERGTQGPSVSEETLKSLIDQAITDRLGDFQRAQGPQGPSVSEETLKFFIDQVITDKLEDFQGAQGPQSPPMSEETLKSLIDQATTDRLEDFRGAQGPQGPQGLQGLQGAPGPQGPVGLAGVPAMVVSKPDVPPSSNILVGTWQVGIDILPGRYWTEGPSQEDFGSCYWARLKGFSGSTIPDILANDNVQGPSYVDIASSDVGFKTGCIWVRVAK